MTPCRRRKKLSAQRSTEARQKIAKRIRQALKYIPAPPGITYWHQVTIRANQDTKVWQPKTNPLAQCDNDLNREEIIHSLSRLKWLAQKHSLPVDWEELPEIASRHLSG